MDRLVTVSTGSDTWARSVVDIIAEQSKAAIEARAEYTLVLAGGSTPLPVYQLMADNPDWIDWQRTFVFWGDERCVAPDHPDSNYGMAKRVLLDFVPVQPANIYRMMGEIEPQAGAQDYEQMIAAFFIGKEKRFDTVLLGLGEDGHTASLFPDTEALKETARWAAANPHPYSDGMRLTLTFTALNAARDVLFLVTGENKAEVAAEVIENPDGRPPYPAKRVGTPHNPPRFILDPGAAGKL